MEEAFLETESREANRRIRKLFVTLALVVAALIALVYALTKSSGGLGEFKGILFAMGGFVLLCAAARKEWFKESSGEGTETHKPFKGVFGEDEGEK